MKAKPIIFSAPMVRALLDGRKTQTRRVLKPSKVAKARGYADLRLDVLDGMLWWWDGVHDRVGASQPFPYAPGDRLWVREACRAVEHEDGTDAVEYLADAACARIANTMQAADQWLALYHYGARGPDLKHREGQKVPSIHMPRWASRLSLVVTDVRVQRLQKISEADAMAEGVMPDGYGGWRGHKGTIGYPTAVWGFHHLWDSLHGPDAWDANPWVAALTFTVHRCNIDQMEGM